MGVQQVERNKKARKAVAILTTLLVVSLLVLGGNLVLGNFAGITDATASSSDNVISSVGGGVFLRTIF